MKQIDGNAVVTVHQHIITRGFWEYYICDKQTDSHGNVFAIVMGHETEMGDVNIPEIKPHILSVCTDFEDLAPAEGWMWA